MDAELEEFNWKENFLANETPDVCVLWNIFKTKIHQLRDKFVPTSSSNTPYWKQKGSVPISSKVQNLICEKGSITQSFGKK